MTTSRGHRWTLLAVHAHPDDESLGTGGILARYAAEGVRTVLVTCTGGEVGGISDPALAGPEDLGDVRLRELADAARILGVGRTVLLEYRDSGMAGDPANGHPDCFHRADLDRATGRLVRVIREERPHVVVTYDETGGYGHPDHVKAHRVTAAAFRAAGDPARFPDAGGPWAPSKLYFEAFPRAWVDEFARVLREAGIEAPYSAPSGVDAGDAAEFGMPDELVTTAVDVAAYVDAKRAALAAHRTQMGPGHFLIRIPGALARRLWAREYFRRAVGPGAGRLGRLEVDLFAGLRPGPP